MAKRKKTSFTVAKLLLLPIWAAYVWLLPLIDIHCLEFVKRLRDAWGVGDYNINFIILAASFIGLLLLIVAGPEKKALNAAGSILVLAPIWFIAPETTGSIGAKAFSSGGFDFIKLALSACTALWAFAALRSSSGTGAVCALLLIAECVLRALYDFVPLDWADYSRTLAAAAVLGALLNALSYNVRSWDLLMPAAVLLIIVLPVLGVKTVTAFYAAATVSGVMAVILLFLKPGKNSYVGYILVLAGACVNALSVLYANGALKLNGIF